MDLPYLPYGARILVNVKIKNANNIDAVSPAVRLKWNSFSFMFMMFMMLNLNVVCLNF